MTWRDFITVLRRSLIRRPQDDRDLDDEIRFHLAQETQLLTDRGQSAEDARQAARRAFGSVALAKENTRAVWISTTIEQFVQDVRFGWRIFRSAPGLSATAVLLIALVIGGNTTVFSIAHGILAKPAPGVTAPRLVTLSWIDDKGRVEPFNSYVAYDSFRRTARGSSACWPGTWIAPRSIMRMAATRYNARLCRPTISKHWVRDSNADAALRRRRLKQARMG